jgi:membrane carboxypeptidase/penicillin-binding protein
MVAETEWRQTFIEEMRMLISIEQMPEKLKNQFM